MPLILEKEWSVTELLMAEEQNLIPKIRPIDKLKIKKVAVFFDIRDIGSKIPSPSWEACLR